MGQRNAIQIVAEKGKQECFIIREFDASRELVFRAFSDPEIFVQFWGPDNTVMKLDYYDFRSGGAYRYMVYNNKGIELCAFSGMIHEVSASERVIQTSEFENLPERGHVVLEALLFEALPGNRTKLTIHDVCMSVADRDAMISSGMETGLSEGFKRLDKILDSLTPLWG
jgi:uncharacterized protein YndB with AHSA1/START domain